MPTSKKKKRPSQQEAKRRETEAPFPYPCPPISPSRGPALLAALANLPSRDRPSRGRRRGRPRTLRRSIYQAAGSYKERTGFSWHRTAKKFLPNEYEKNPEGCVHRLRMGVKRVEHDPRRR